ncbi:hypothetical protein MJL79_30965, partial [Salmonella enterica subsp. enterica serovar Montevideo]|nr:hypothetical protein [Salmonella enterica subsp. enterica serovar Montevideo]
MRNFDLSPLYRSAIGFDRLFNLLENNQSHYSHAYGKQVNFLSGGLLPPPAVECNRKQLNMCGCSYYYILVT